MSMSSSKAENRPLADWFQIIKTGQLKLPRFQRDSMAWDRQRIKSFLDTIIYDLPVGVTLVLKVGDKEKFKSRYIETAGLKESPNINEHLLDGQQRLTAFWRSMHNNYEYETYFIYFPEYDIWSDDPDNKEIYVHCVPRHFRENKRFPIWADQPWECFKRGCIPMNLFSPNDNSSEIEKWIERALCSKELVTDAEKLKFHQLKDELRKSIDPIREIVKYYNLPYLSLPINTQKEVALKVFINMNTNSKPLSIYDIVVAEVELEKGESLQDLTKSLDDKYPILKNYSDLPSLILMTSALLQEKTPNNRGIIDMHKPKLVENWQVMEKCLDRMSKFLVVQGIYDKQRLPTNAILAVISAVYSCIPEAGDQSGVGEMLVQKYLWSAFFTDRYENSAASRAFADYIALKSILSNKTKKDGSLFQENDVPALNRSLFPLADEDELISAKWPKNMNIRGRAILAISTYLGAKDFADGQAISGDNIVNRHYHHLFPDALLEEAKVDSGLALNCALITGLTNQKIGRKDPLAYLKDRYKWVEQEIVDERLNSHLIPLNELACGTYEGLDQEQKAEKIKSDFRSFINARAKLIHKAMTSLTNGKSITWASVFQTNELSGDNWLDLINGLENKTTEFKSTLSYCLKQNAPPSVIEHASIKNLAAFLNSDGGHLFIGLKDTEKNEFGERIAVGLDYDLELIKGRGELDDFLLHIDNLVSSQLGDQFQRFISVKFHDYQSKKIAEIIISGRAHKPVWMNDKGKDVLYVRRQASTVALAGKEIAEYINDQW